MSDTSTICTPASLDVPGARLHYEVRGHGPARGARRRPDGRHGVRAAGRPARRRPHRAHHRPAGHQPQLGRRPRPGLDPGDARRRPLPLLTHLDAGPAAVFGSSGGAVSALALAQAHPEQVHTVIAHEPPLDELLDDREQLRARTDDLIATYLAGDVQGAWRKFLAQADISLPEPVFEQMFGGERDPQAAADERFWFAHEMRPTTRWQPDLAALRAGPTRIVVGIGEESAGQLCDRTSTALAAALGIEPTVFPGGHIGFVEDPGPVRRPAACRPAGDLTGAVLRRPAVTRLTTSWTDGGATT